MPQGLERQSGAAKLVARALWRRARRRLRLGPRYTWRFAGRVPDRVRIAPPDMRLADPEIALEIYSSRFPLAGRMVDTGGASPFEATTGDAGWRKALNGFRWLRHLSAAGTDLAAHNARALVADWTRCSTSALAGPAWDAGTTAKRIISWLQHSPLILAGAELPFYRAFLASLAMQVRYLRAAAPEMEIGKDRLRARIAIAFASLSLPSSTTSIRAAARLLDAELKTQILADGGHISRNPLVLMELLADLLPLRQTYVDQATPPPAGLASAIDRMMQAVKFFRHADGSLARFNGMGMTIQERVNAVLRHDDPAALPLTHMPASGYDRLSLGSTIVLVDTGAPPPVDASMAAHAGCLSFEMSSGRHCIVVNCGVDSYGPASLRPLGRTTAAHSTATVENTSQARFDHPARLRKLIGEPLLGGPRKISRRRADRGDLQAISADHDAYGESFGIIHQRELRLSEHGAVLSGNDRFISTEEGAVAVALRFHLHPDVEPLPADDGIALAIRGERLWTFQCANGQVEIERSIFFAAAGGRREASQLVFSAADARDRDIAWRFVRQER